MKLYFSDFFEVPPETIEEYGAFNISLLSDLPLFIDPFLLFNSDKEEYQRLHDEIINYLKFLRDKAASGELDDALIANWYRFPEIKQNWLGFSFSGNRGSGLGKKFAYSLHANLGKLFGDFGEESITIGSHLEKLCLVAEGVGKDTISDFTTNLTHRYLLKYTQDFCIKYVDKKFLRRISAKRVEFNYLTETWVTKVFELPTYRGNYVLLTPKDILTRDDTWISKTELLENFMDIPSAIPDEQLRAQVNNYFISRLYKDKKQREEPSKKEFKEAARETLLEYPKLIDYFIRYKEEDGDRAVSISSEKVKVSKELYIEQFQQLPNLLEKNTDFYKIPGTTYDEALARVRYLKDIIENKGGHRIFYVDGEPLRKEEDVQILFRLTWFASSQNLSREVNDGRGPVDFMVSYGSQDKTLVEFKLAKNSKLKSNLEKQTKIYEKASDAKRSLKVIFFFTYSEKQRVLGILRQLRMENDPDVILVDARDDNKPSGSKA